MCIRDRKPVAEIQFLDFIYPAFDQIVSELAKMRYRSGGQYPCHVVVRAPYGGGIKGGLYHSQSTEAYFCHTAGLKVVVPSTPADAKGLLLTAVADEDPMSEMTLVQAVNRGLHEAMGADPDVVVLGEDVGVNGGVFRATDGLLKEFGAERVLDTPLSETGIVGSAIGMALYGLKPVAEIQFLDFIYPAFDQIVSELAKMRYRSGGQYLSLIHISEPTRP